LSKREVIKLERREERGEGTDCQEMKGDKERNLRQKTVRESLKKTGEGNEYLDNS
jgi:hypothetical protein